MTEGQAPDGAPQPDAAPPPLAQYVNPPLSAPAEPMPPQPAVAWAQPPAVAVVQGGRTGLAAVAGVMLLVLGIIGGLLGLFVAVVGQSLIASMGEIVEVPGLDDPGGFLGGMVAFLGILVVVYSLVYVFGGIGILRSRSWGRVMGLIVGILSGLIWLGGLGSPEQGSLPFTVVLLGIHVYVVVVLILFWRTKTA